jgi:hypothetical protein
MAKKNNMPNDGITITDEDAEKIVQDVYSAIDRGEYKVITERVKKNPSMTVPDKEIRNQLLKEIENI